MKKIVMLILCLTSAILTIKAQNYTHEFGKFSSEEFQMKKYDKDPSAEAVVIYDIGTSFFTRDDDGFKLIFERKMKIKIFNKAGLKWAQQSIPFYEENSRAEIIVDLKGNTYNFENGQVKISALDPKNSYNEKYSEHWYDKKFAMPDVKEGSVIEIYYRVVSPYLFNLRSWEFQCGIPVIYSEYTTKMIPFYEYVYIIQGTSKFDTFKTYNETSSTSPFGLITYDDVVYFFSMKDVPAFKDESFVTTSDDYIIKLDFQLAAIHHPGGVNQSIMSTWTKLSEEMIDNASFGKYMNNCKKKGKEITDTMKIASKSLTDKAKYIEHFVKTNFNWNGKSDKFATKSVKDILASKTGNCSDINLLLAGLLNSAGIEAYPVLISTRDHGKIKLDYPFQHFFNYVLISAKIDSSTVLLDATEPFSNFGEIPSRCINEKGLVIQKNKTEWVSLKSNSTSTRTYNLNLNLTQGKDSIQQNCKLVTTGFEAIDYRERYTSSYKDLKSDLYGQNASPSDTLLPLNLKQIEKPFEITFNKKNVAETIEDKVIISPFCNFALSKNPLTQPTRNYPVDIIYKKSNKFQTSIAIPNGYELVSKPLDMNINNNLVKAVFMTDIQSDGHINIVGNYEFKKDVYDISDYAELKKYFKMIVDKFNEKIVISKKV